MQTVKYETRSCSIDCGDLIDGREYHATTCGLLPDRCLCCGGVIECAPECNGYEPRIAQKGR